jgi:DNA-binding NarL/FixJ family response regulator
MADEIQPVSEKESISTIKVMLVDDHPIVRQGLRDVLENTSDITVCSESGNANEAIAFINREKPDVVIVDIMLDGNVNGIELVKSISERFPEIYTLVLSMHDESIYAERAIKAGARGYLMKDVAPRNIADAIRTIKRGDLYLKDDLSKKILEKMLNKNSDQKTVSTDRLTNRELEIFQYIGNGCSIKEIAQKLNLSIYTVESHRRSIKVKMNIKTSADLTKNAIQWVIMLRK